MRKIKEEVNEKDYDVVADVQEEETEDLSDMNLEEKIKYWKEKYGKLYKTEFDNEYYIWRRIKRKEFINLFTEVPDDEENKDLVYWQRQEVVCKRAVLYPENIAQKIENCAGLATILSEEIMYKSGFGTLGMTTKEI